MKTNKLLMIGVGMVVLYVLYKKFYAKESEETASASGIWTECRCTDPKSGGIIKRKCRKNKVGEDCNKCCNYHHLENLDRL